MIAELAALVPTDPGTRAQLDRLAAAYEAAYAYQWHAWHACGSVAAPPPRVPGQP